jgi:hypothetical protein
VHLSDAIDQDRLNQNVGNYRIDVGEPLHSLRIRLDKTEGIAADLTWNGLFDVVRSSRTSCAGQPDHPGRAAVRPIRVLGGHLEIDGEEIAVDPSVWIGSRDRSWGIRPIGEAEPAGRPADPPFEGMWWLYIPMAFDDFDRGHHSGGAGRLPLAQRLHADLARRPGRATRLAAGEDPLPLRHPHSDRRHHRGHRRRRRRCASMWSRSCRCRSTSAAATAATRDWIHGVWKGEKFTERLTYDMTDPAIIGRSGFGVIDHVGRGVPRRRQGLRGLGPVRARRAGPARPVGFADWLTVAP